MNLCPECDYENADESRVCDRCGAKLPRRPSAVSPAPPSDLPGPLAQEIETLLRAGRKIDAIKVYREAMGCDLKAAKDAVEALGRTLGIASTGSGCAGVLALGLLIGWNLFRILQ